MSESLASSPDISLKDLGFTEADSFAAEVPAGWEVLVATPPFDALGRSWAAVDFASPDHALDYPPLGQYFLADTAKLNPLREMGRADERAHIWSSNQCRPISRHL